MEIYFFNFYNTYIYYLRVMSEHWFFLYDIFFCFKMVQIVTTISIYLLYFSIFYFAILPLIFHFWNFRHFFATFFAGNKWIVRLKKAGIFPAVIYNIWYIRTGDRHQQTCLFPALYIFMLPLKIISVDLKSTTFNVSVVWALR